MSKPLAETVIAGFTVTVEPNEDREGVNCWLTKGRHGNSLAMIEDHGYIEVDGGTDIPVSAAVIARARTFAERHGY